MEAIPATTKYAGGDDGTLQTSPPFSPLRGRNALVRSVTRLAFPASMMHVGAPLFFDA